MSNDIQKDKANAARVKNVRLWIKESGLKQTYVSRKLGLCHPSYLSQMVGKGYSRKIPLKLYTKLSLYFNKY